MQHADDTDFRVGVAIDNDIGRSRHDEFSCAINATDAPDVWVIGKHCDCGTDRLAKSRRGRGIPYRDVVELRVPRT
jgi:hypothetical protein